MGRDRMVSTIIKICERREVLVFQGTIVVASEREDGVLLCFISS